MADTSTRVSGPVTIEQTSREAVAFSLMEKIASYEGGDADKKNRKYWLSLYRQCYKATGGSVLESILEVE